MFKRIAAAVCLAVLIFFVAQPSVFADPTDEDSGQGLSTAQKTLHRQGVNMFDIKKNGGLACTTSSGSDSAAVDTADIDDASLTGVDNAQKAFNYFKDAEGLTDVQAAGIVGNLIQESGVNPKINQGGGGVGKGIAQWSPDRWGQLVEFSGSEAKARTLGKQLQFMSLELHHQAPATGDYRGVLDKLKQQTAAFEATGFFMGTIIAQSAPHLWKPDAAAVDFVKKYGAVGGFENPGRPELKKRVDNANSILQKYGSGTSGNNVTGTNAACGSVGAVDCNATGEAVNSGLSQVRQNVVCIAQQELKLWDDGTMKPGTDFYKYVTPKSMQVSTTPWCAGFVSYVYKQAGYPVNSEGYTLSSQQFLTLDKFDNHKTGSNYTPVPGDVVVFTYSQSSGHVNIVTSVNKNNKTMTVIGGNQSGNVAGSGADSSVTQYTTSYATSELNSQRITSFASPKEN